MTQLRDPAAFFASLRHGDILGPTLTQDEVDGCTAILEAVGEVDHPLAWAAYELATAYHETAHTMQPVKEIGGDAYFRRMYDIQGARPDLAKRLGNTEPGDGAKYAGRGYVQLTGRANYARAARELEEPLVENPDLAQNPTVAAKIMVTGMSEGWFTGKTLAIYLPHEEAATRAQFEQARRIINGSDRAQLIAGYAIGFQNALETGKWA